MATPPVANADDAESGSGDSTCSDDDTNSRQHISRRIEESICSCLVSEDLRNRLGMDNIRRLSEKLEHILYKCEERKETYLVLYKCNTLLESRIIMLARMITQLNLSSISERIQSNQSGSFENIAGNVLSEFEAEVRGMRSSEHENVLFGAKAA